MKVLILAAGEGKRMKPIQTCKSRLKFLGKELILYKIEILEKAGLRDFIIVCNPDNIDKMKKLVGEKVQYAIQQKPNGMADAILSAKELVKGEEVIITNAEDFVEKEAYENLVKRSCDSCLVGKKVNEYFPGGYFKLDGDQIKEIVEKPKQGEEPSDLISIGIYFHRKFDKLIEYIENVRTDKDDQYEVAMNNMIKDGFIFKVAKYEGEWIPIKYPWHMFDLLKYFLDKVKRKISNTAVISPKATIEGNVIIEDGVKVFEGAIIKGPCYIGKNSIVGTNTLIRNYSQLGDDCIVGYSTEITNSWIGDDCWFHTNYVGDSIIGDNCSFGSGAVTANFRFDGKRIKVKIRENDIDSGRDKLGAIVGEDSQIGVNAIILPGKKLGPNSIVGPGVCLQDDLESNKIILVDKKSYTIKENEIKASLEKKKELMKRLVK